MVLVCIYLATFSLHISPRYISVIHVLCVCIHTHTQTYIYIYVYIHTLHQTANCKSIPTSVLLIGLNYITSSQPFFIFVLTRFTWLGCKGRDCPSTIHDAFLVIVIYVIIPTYLLLLYPLSQE